MRRKEGDAGPLSEALKDKQPLLPFLSFCGLTNAKRSCCSAGQGGLGCLQNTQYHQEQQAGKTSTTEGWQHLPPEELSMLKSLGNQGGVGWDHCRLKDSLKSNTWSSEPQFTARPLPLVLGMGNTVPSSQSDYAHKHPMDPQGICAARQEREQEAVESLILFFPQWWGAPTRHAKLLSS